MKRIFVVVLSLVLCLTAFIGTASASGDSVMSLELVSLTDWNIYLDDSSSVNIAPKVVNKSSKVYTFFSPIPVSGIDSGTLIFTSPSKPVKVEVNYTACTLVSSSGNEYKYKVPTSGATDGFSIRFTFSSAVTRTIVVNSCNVSVGDWGLLSGTTAVAGKSAAFGNTISIPAYTSASVATWYRVYASFTPNGSDKYCLFATVLPPDNVYDATQGVAYQNGYQIPVTTRFASSGSGYTYVFCWINSADLLTQDDQVTVWFHTKQAAVSHEVIVSGYWYKGLNFSEKSISSWLFKIWEKIDSGFKSILAALNPSHSDESKEQLDKKTDELNKANDALNSATKPNVDDINVDIDSMVSQSDISDFSAILAVPLGSSNILPLFIVSMTFCLVAYVFYGKR